MPQETDILALNSALLSGGIALLPTETVYGLGADAGNQTAVNKLYHAKGRDFDKPIAICVRDIKAATSLVHWSETAQQLAAFCFNAFGHRRAAPTVTSRRQLRS